MSDLNLRPFRGRIYVSIESAEDRVGSIIVPEKSREGASWGRVLARAPDTGVEVGDRLIFSRKDVTQLSDGCGNEFLIVFPSNVLAVLDPEAPDVAPRVD